MDCHEPVDDYCDVLPAGNLEIPKEIPSANNLDHFYITFDVETIAPFLDDDEGGDQDLSVEVLDTNLLKLWVPCPRIGQENLTKDTISKMLTRAGVPLHKQVFMVDKISARADEIANAAYNKDRRVLPMRVLISMVACLCCGESVED